MRAAAVVLALALPAHAASECPVPEDLSRGLYIVAEGGDVVRYTPHGAGHVLEETHPSEGGENYAFVLWQGLLEVDDFSLDGGRIVPGSRTATTYTRLPESVEAIPPGEPWRTPVVQQGPDGTRMGSVTIRREPSAPETIAGCRFEISRVAVERIWIDGERVDFEILYLPRFGVGLLVNLVEAGEAFPTVIERIGAGFPPGG